MDQRLDKIPLDVDPASVKIKECSFSVRVYNLPINRMTEAMAELIGNKIGKFVELLPRVGFDLALRIKIKVNVDSPLVRLVRVKTDLGADLYLRIAYEKLQNFCYLCGLLNHTERVCELRYQFEQDTEFQSPFGSWLRAEDKGTFRGTGAANSRTPSPRNSSSVGADNAKSQSKDANSSLQPSVGDVSPYLADTGTSRG